MEHEHLLALSTLLYVAPLAVLAQAAAHRVQGLERRLAGAPASARISGLLLLVAGGVHLCLAGRHAAQPVLALAFAVAAAAQLTLAGLAALDLGGWRLAALVVTAAAMVAFPLTRVAGLESGVDSLGAATLAIEAATLIAIRPNFGLRSWTTQRSDAPASWS